MTLSAAAMQFDSHVILSGRNLVMVYGLGDPVYSIAELAWRLRSVGTLNPFLIVSPLHCCGMGRVG